MPKWFFTWVVLGAAVCFGVLSLFSIGFLVLPLALPATVLLGRLYRTREGVPGFVSGLGLPPLLVAFLSRGGPGTFCTTKGTTQSCGERLNPWPWLVAGLLLFLAGFALVALRARRTRFYRSTT